jgi:hypothetical protein
VRRIALALALLGCGSPPTGNCTDAIPYEGAPGASLSVRGDGGAPWADGEAVAFELGPQGGFMVQPVLVLDPAEVPPDTLAAPLPEHLCARIEVENVDPTGGTRFEGFDTFTLSVPFRRDAGTGRYESPVLANQLRWSPLPPGTAYRFAAVARFEDFAAEVQRELTLR